MKKCPSCAKINKNQAVACKYCGGDLGPPKPSRLPQFMPSRPFFDVAPSEGGLPEGGGNRVRFMAILIVVAVVCLGAYSFLQGTQSGQTAGTPTPGIGADLTASADLHFQLHGDGNGTTQLFQAPRSWQVKWSYDCHAVGPDGTGSFVLSIFDADKKPVKAGLVSETGSKDSAIAHGQTAGNLFLQVDSPCSWDLDVSG